MDDADKVVSLFTREAYEGPGGEPREEASAEDVGLLSIVMDQARSGKTDGFIIFAGIKADDEGRKRVMTFSNVAMDDYTQYIGHMEILKTSMIAEKICDDDNE